MVVIVSLFDQKIQSITKDCILFKNGCDKIYFMSIQKYLDGLEDLTGKQVIITGGTSGIGLAIVKHLLYKNADVVILARNKKKYDDTRNHLLEKFPSGNIDFIPFDQSNDESIKNAVEEIIKNYPNFYALILNAGLMQPKKYITMTDGYPTTIKTNYVGEALFIKCILPYLKEEQRIILQGSLGAGLCFGKVDTLKKQKPKMFRQYFISKAGVEALFYHYSFKEKTKASFYLVEPGVTNSGIIRDYNPIIRYLGSIFLKLVSHSPDKAALTAMKALDMKTKKGAYIVPRGLCTYRGFPKVKVFPKRRQREYLVDLLDQE